jgi:hypothetical protein
MANTATHVCSTEYSDVRVNGVNVMRLFGNGPLLAGIGSQDGLECCIRRRRRFRVLRAILVE